MGMARQGNEVTEYLPQTALAVDKASLRIGNIKHRFNFWSNTLVFTSFSCSTKMCPVTSYDRLQQIDAYLFLCDSPYKRVS